MATNDRGTGHEDCYREKEMAEPSPEIGVEGEHLRLRFDPGRF